MKKSNSPFSILHSPVILLILVAGCTSSQNHEEQQNVNVVVRDSAFASPIDSLEWVLTAGTEMERKNALFDLALNYSSYNRALSNQYARDLLHLSQQTKDKKSEGNAYHCMASGFFFENKHDSALYYRYKALALYEELKIDERVIMTKLNIAKSLSSLFKLDESLKIMLECLDYYTENSMQFERANTIQAIGELYGDMAMLDLAIDYYSQALSAYEALESDTRIERNRGLCYTNIGEFFYQKFEFEKAIEYRGKSLEIFRKLNDIRLTIIALKGRSNAFSSLNRFDEAERDLNELIELAEKTDNNSTRSEALMTKCYFYYAKKDYKQGLECAIQAYAMTDTTAKRMINIIHYHLALLSAHAGTPEETVKYLNEFDNSTKEVFNEEWSSRLTEMEVKYETEKKQLEIEKQKNVIARQNMQRLLLAGGVALCVVILTLLWYLLRLRNRRNLALTERNDFLSEMNVTKDKFFNIISHDLKNPALALHDNLRLLVSNVRRWDADMLSDFSNELLHAAEGQVELLNSLLNWARIQTGRITCTPATFDLAARLRTDISLVRKMAENKGITLDCQMPDGAIVHGDSNMLLTVVRNLLTNAIKFTAPGGTVTLAISTDTVISQSAPTCIISITDTGTGMTPEQIKNLFRLDKPQTRRGTAGEEGSGLGLIVCKELLSKHGSVLHVESREEKGSRFWFELRDEPVSLAKQLR